ncbi:MAG: hypothetical protein BRC40_02935 [Cyanobacteria bacterium QH_8_48_120]|nr:MAG: hypothetical protein BRC40_02935 [Cyanobacteria bacterium QH_8_48_120]
MQTVTTEPSFTRYLSLIDDPEAFQACLARPLPTCIWANPLKTTPEAVAKFMQAQGVECESRPWHKNVFRSRNWDKPGSTVGFAAGWYNVQEEISLTAARVLDPQPGECILDLCAAPGCKTVQIASRIAGSGMVVANEVQIPRLAILQTMLNRMGLLNTIVTNDDGGTIPLPPHSFDRVLVDAPCSGEGAMRKSRASWKEWNPQYSRQIASTQRKLLDRALQFVKPGGIVVYSTCTFAPEENEATIDAVLGDRGYVEPAEIPALRAMPGLLQWKQQSFRADLVRAQRYFPHFNDTGGFFVARIRRTDVELNPPTAEPETHQHQATPLDNSYPLEWFCQRFGIDPAVFSGLRLWVKGKDKIWIAETACEPTLQPMAQTIGIPFLRLLSRTFKPTTSALQRFGRYATRNIIELNNCEAAWQFLAGQSQHIQASANSGYVHVRYGSFELGCGLYQQGCLYSQVPKNLRAK